MFRYLLCAILSAVLWAGLLASSYAQAGGENLTPRPVGDKGWCTVTADSPAGTAECGYNSPEAACERQNSSFNPLGSLRFVGVTISDVTERNAGCEYIRTPVVGEIPNLLASVSKQCEFGFSVAGDTCRQVEECTTCNASQEAGNPINFISGEKKDVRIDYKSADGRFVIKRHYNSAPFAAGGNPTSMRKEFGHNWFLGNFPTLGASTGHALGGDFDKMSYKFTHSTGYYVGLVNNINFDVVGRGSSAAGSMPSPFRATHPDGSVQVGTTGSRRVLVTHNNGTEYGFIFPLVSGTATRGVVRKPVTVDFGEGYIHTHTYDENGFLSTITDTYGRQASFEYNINQWQVANGREEDVVINGVPYDRLESTSTAFREPETGTVKRINFPDSTYVEFEYDSVSEFSVYWQRKERLLSATKYDPNDNEIHKEIYHYEDPRIPYAMTGITDDAGIRFATWTYDEQGRANSSEHAGGVNRVDIVHNDEIDSRFDATTRDVTNALGHTKTYNIGSITSDYEISSVTGEGTVDVKPTNESYRYVPGTGGISEIVDPLSRTEDRSLDVRGFPLSKTYAKGTSEEFESTYEWNERFQRPTQTAMPGLTTDYVYDDDGRILEMVQTDTSDNPAPERKWLYTWVGPNLTSVDGPLPGTIDVASFSYLNEKLTEVRNEVGHITSITSHNAIGAPSTFEDPNGVITTLSYDARHRLKTITRAGAITEITYSPTNLTTSITLPNGNRLGFTYNDGRQLTGISNGAGETVEYTRNAMGGILSKRIPDSSGTIQYSMTQVRDEINRVVEATGVNWTSSYEYDEMNNLTDVTDGRSNEWKQNFDNLDRLKEEINPLGGTVDYDLDNQMDSRNPLSRVTDERGVETQYVRNGFGEVIREISLEAGTTEYVRDVAGRITQMTDARGVVSDYAYDGMDRLLSVTYPAASIDDITYGYDAGDFGVGELTSITEGFGTTTYGYNDLAQMIAMTRSINGVDYACVYEYDLAGEVTAIIYPSGRRIEYTRDGAAREISIVMVSTEGTRTTLAESISYKPFGPIDGMTLGDGHSLSIDYDANYRAVRLTRSGTAGTIMDLGFTYDEDSDITGLQDYLRPERSQVLGYDALSRLTSATGGYGDIDYGYNAGGDRTSRDWTLLDGTQTSETYSYDGVTARLMDVSTADAGGTLTPIREFAYHASGQVSEDLRGANSYLYGLNDRGRLTTITRNGAVVADYIHDESEQRIAKTVDGQIIHYHYDLDGRLISETDVTTGESLRDYVWLGLMPIAVIDATEEAPDTACEAEIAALQELIEDRTTRIDNNAEGVANLFGLISEKEGRIDVITAAITNLEALSLEKTTRIDNNAARITELGDLITDKQSRIAVIETAIETLNGLITDKTARVEAINAAIDRLNGLIAEHEAEQAGLDPASVRYATLTGLIETRSARVIELAEQVEVLTTAISAHAVRVDELAARSLELQGLSEGHAARIDAIAAINLTLTDLRDAHDVRVGELTTRNGELAALITTHEDRIAFLSERNFVLAEQLAQFEADLLEAEANCDTVAADGLYYLHADHLGRPQFATDITGVVVWDMGEGVTPFGDSVNLAGAFAQRLMFPGQYADVETGGEGDDVTLSHNWHRTYDPTLGRYLQSDPIGLAGGLNRYAYVGGNPIGMIDPTGLDGILTIYNDDNQNPWGHAWISYKPIGPSLENGCGCDNQEKMFGTFPSSPDFKGIFSGYVRTGDEARGNHPITQSRSMKISDSQEIKLFKMIRAYQAENGGDAWRVGNACTAFASNTWFAATGEKLKQDLWWGSSSAEVFGRSIKTANGGQNFSPVPNHK